MLTFGDIRIRPAQADDVDVIASFSAAMALETERRRLDLATLRQGTLSLVENPAFGFLQVAEVTDGMSTQLVGQLMVTYEWSDWRNGAFWWIQSVYVVPAWRRRGIFRRMHAAILTAAKARPDVCGIRLYVETDNHVAQSVYRRVGLMPSCYTVYEEDFSLAHRAPLEDRPHEA
jgi:GNAT superfamily N-acetyltransferase